MKKIVSIIILVLITGFVYPQEVEFLTGLSEKENSVFEDLVIAFCLLNNIKITKDFNKNAENLKKIIKYFPRNYTKDKPLTYGDFSLFAIQQLKIKSGIFYSATKTGRYAIRELMLLDLIPMNTSELERMSGLELIRYLEKVVEYENNKKE